MKMRINSVGDKNPKIIKRPLDFFLPVAAELRLVGVEFWD